MPMAMNQIEYEDYRDMTPERKAVVIAGKALGLELQDYTMRLCAAVRTHRDIDLKAFDDEDALAQVKLFTPDSTYFGEDYTLEGDEVVYLLNDEMDYIDEDGEDMRTAGEPFSWRACELIKQIAALGDEPDTSMLSALAIEARKACRKDG